MRKERWEEKKRRGRPITEIEEGGEECGREDIREKRMGGREDIREERPA